VTTAVLFATLLILANPVRAQESIKSSAAAKPQTKSSIKIKLTSVLVDDQEKALKFYTEVLGFQKKWDIPVGGAKWLTVVSREEPNGTELLLEPDGNPAAKVFKKAMFDQGIPFAAFLVDDLQLEYNRLLTSGVVFRVKPTSTGPTMIAIFDDTCGNLIQLYQITGK
jgi:catechol 2,3-dioxygenase-like lactoylglutathione lyase family enzyme